MKRSESKRRSSANIIPINFLKEDENQNECFSKIKFHRNSTFGRIIDFMNLVNLLYVAASIPMLISFDIKMSWELILMEILSILFT